MTSQGAQLAKRGFGMSKKKQMSTGYLVRTALFSALAFVVMFWEFPIGAVFPTFLQVDLSDVVVFIGGIVLGPAAVVMMEFIKNLLHLLVKGGTAGIGEIANFIVGIALILPPVYFIRKKDTIKSSVIGFSAGIILMILVASVSNYFVFLPLYKSVLSFDITYIFPTKMASIIYGFAPFNAIKGLIIAAIGISLHRSMGPVYKYLK